jgi:hypothetical protein
MTFLGKLFVIFNVAVSLFMAFAAFALYANSVDWGYDAAKPGQQGGIIKEKQDLIKEFQGAQGGVENGWRTARTMLWMAEEARRDDRAFYVNNLEYLRSKAKDGEPAEMVETVNALPVRDPAKKNRPKMKVAKVRGDKEKEADLDPLFSREYYRREYDKLLTTNIELLQKIAIEAKRDIIWTNKLLDVAKVEERNPYRDDKPPVMDDPDEEKKEPYGLRGLRTLLVDERVKRQGVQREFAVVDPLFVNTKVENQLIRKRLEALNEHIAELEAYISKRKLDVEITKR